MIAFKDKIDDIFQALYGESENDDNEKYSEYYRYEVKAMEVDFYEYIELMKKLSCTISVDDLVKFVIWTEYEHIGNVRYSAIVDYERLTQIIAEISGL